MNFNNISPYIRVAMDNIIYPPWKMKERVIFDYELLFVKKGHILVTIEENKFEGKPGDVFIFKPKEKHSIDILGDDVFQQPHLHFDFYYDDISPKINISFKNLWEMNSYEKNLFRENILSTLENFIPNKITLKKPEYFLNLLNKIIFEYERKNLLYELQIKGMFIELWCLLLKEIENINNFNTKSNIFELEKIQRFIINNTGRNINLDELVTLSNMSKYHLIREFKKTYGITPIQYHNNSRLEKAKYKILYSNDSISEIANNFGFSSIHSFSRAFKNSEGIYPSELK